jgi:hypothetical protein
MPIFRPSSPAIASDELYLDIDASGQVIEALQ